MRYTLWFAVVLAAVQMSDAQTIGKYAGEFLTFGVGGRALALGGASTAIARDASAGYWNPAGVSSINYPEVIAMHDERFGNLINYDFVSIAIPYESDAALGLSVFRLGVDGIPDTRNAWIDYNGNGVFDNVDRLDYDKITYFNSADWAVYATYSKRVSPDFSYGANIKFIRRSIAEFSATGIGFDVGVLYMPMEDVYLGMNAQDITTTFVAWSTGRTELITPTIKTGAAYFFDLFSGRFCPTIDVDVRFENRKFASIANIGPISLDPHFGLEYEYKHKAALRIGYSDLKQLTIGAGIHFNKLDIDYAFAKFGNQENDLGNTHRISLRFILENENYARTVESK
jgi:hypothetical protein